MYGINCGKEIPPDHFCIYCGSKIEAESIREQSHRWEANKKTPVRIDLPSEKAIVGETKETPGAGLHMQKEKRCSTRRDYRRKKRKALQQKVIVATLVTIFFSSIFACILLAFLSSRQDRNETVTASDTAALYTGEPSPNRIYGTKYYGAIHNISSDGIARVTLKKPYTYTDAFVSSITEGSTITVNGTDYLFSAYVAPGGYGEHRIKNGIYFFDRDAEHSHWYGISQSGLNGEWILSGPSDMPVYSGREAGEYCIASDLRIKDSLYQMQHDAEIRDASVWDMIARYGESDFYTHNFVLTIQDNQITELEMIFMA